MITIPLFKRRSNTVGQEPGGFLCNLKRFCVYCFFIVLCFFYIAALKWGHSVNLYTLSLSFLPFSP